MARSAATLTVKIVSDAKGASQGFDEAESRVGRFQSGLDKASVAAGGVLLGLGAVAKAAYDSASALQQSSGAVESVFGDQAAAVTDYAKKAADANNLSQNSYQEAASVIGAQLRNMGVAHDDLAPKTDSLIDLGSDLAATFGGTTSDAVSALSSLLRGERDPIERYGITISQAGVDAKVAALGLDTSTEAAKKAAEAQAVMALAYEQGAGAIGATAREQDTAAGASANAAAQFENAKAALGDVLLPVVAAAAAKFAEFTGFLMEHKTVVLAVVAVVAAMAAATIVVNAALSAYRTILIIATALQWAWNVAMAMNPIMLIVIAIAAIIAIVIIAYNKFAWFRTIVDAIGNALLTAFNAARSAIQWVLDKLSFISDAASWVGDLFSAPQTMTVTPVAGGDAAGLFGAATGTPVFGAAMSPGAGGTSPSAGSGPAGGMVVNVTVNGALDPVSVGRQIESVLRQYGRATGRQLALSIT